MFQQHWFICVFVSNFKLNYSAELREHFIRDVSLDKEINIKF